MNQLHLTRRQWNGIALAGLGGCLAGRAAFADEQAAAGRVEEGDIQPLPFVDGSFTVVALPDTQHYSEKYHQHFYNQTEWIVANKDNRDIQFVVHLGDITNRNTRPQWEVAQRAVQRLDGVVPYSLLPGNHDYGENGKSDSRETYLNEYFPLDTVRRQPTFGGVFNKTSLESSYHTFSTRGQKFLVLALEWGPRDEVVAWADEVVGRHKDHRVILTTHAYMYYDETRYDWKTRGDKQRWNPHSYGTAKLDGGTNDGQELWDKLVGKHSNFFMTLNGHVLEDGLARLSTPGTKGNDVHQMLVNYQMKPEGGGGFLRLIEFLPDLTTVQVKAYSPSSDTYKTDPQNQFVLKLQPALGARQA